MKMRMTVTLFTALLIGSMGAFGDNADTELVFTTVPLRGASFEELEPVITPFLSAEGRLSYLPSRRLLLILEHPDRIDLIREVLEEVDVPLVNIRITVTFDEDREQGEAHAGIDNGGIVVTRTERGHTRVIGRGDASIGSSRTTTTQYTSQFIVTTDNHPASIWVGKTVADPVWVFEYGWRRGWWHQELVWRDIGASLWVRPQLVGEGQVRVDVYPRLTVQGENRLDVEVQEAETQIMIPDGGTVTIGGLDADKRELYRHLLGVGRIFDGRRLQITLRADIMPARRPPPPARGE